MSASLSTCRASLLVDISTEAAETHNRELHWGVSLALAKIRRWEGERASHVAQGRHAYEAAFRLLLSPANLRACLTVPPAPGKHDCSDAAQTAAVLLHETESHQVRIQLANDYRHSAARSARYLRNICICTSSCHQTSRAAFSPSQ